MMSDARETVCITGGTGLIGSSLMRILKLSAYRVLVLSREKSDDPDSFLRHWDIENGVIDPVAVENADHFVHLAGASVGEGRWTAERKKEIRDSRIKSTRFLYETLSKLKNRPKTFISASAIGIYGHDTGGVLLDEDRVKPSDDFLAMVTREWEEEVHKIRELGIRVVILRIGVVLSYFGGAVPQLTKLFKLGLGSPVGSGEQYMSWIHLDDLIDLIKYCIENREVEGTFNAVAPHPVTNQEFSKTMAEVMGKPYFMPKAPGFLLRMVLGEKASLVLGGNRVSSKKIMETGFNFKFENIEDALFNILKLKVA
jgi:uncharacterized protein (TIGR01777 family)